MRVYVAFCVDNSTNQGALREVGASWTVITHEKWGTHVTRQSCLVGRDREKASSIPHEVSCPVQQNTLVYLQYLAAGYCFDNTLQLSAGSENSTNHRILSPPSKGSPPLSPARYWLLSFASPLFLSASRGSREKKVLGYAPRLAPLFAGFLKFMGTLQRWQELPSR